MTVYEDINSCEDFGIQAGTYTEMFFECFDTEGEPIYLEHAMKMGCTFSLLEDDKNPVIVIDGEVDNTSTKGNTMVIKILSEHTRLFDNCVLYYRPFIILTNNCEYRWQGRIVVGNTTPFV
jgi:hypothetical protein